MQKSVYIVAKTQKNSTYRSKKMIRTVKNTFAFMTAIALCGVFSACGEEQSQPQQSAEKKQPPQQEQQESRGGEKETPDPDEIGS